MLTLTACDFHPLYGGVSPGNRESAGVSADLSEVRVDTIADRAGQIMRNELIDRLQAEGVPPPPTHHLVVTYSETQQDLGINNNATTTRGQLTLVVNFNLNNLATNSKETAGSVQKITEYNIQSSEFATILSRDDAERRAIREVADNIAERLAIYFRNKALYPERLNKPVVTPPPPAPTMPSLPLNPQAPGFGANVLGGQTPITQGAP
jgi:LPS-assembly lipoprotein